MPANDPTAKMRLPRVVSFGVGMEYPKVPDFALSLKPGDIEPPNYALQGKTRGRKPKRPQAHVEGDLGGSESETDVRGDGGVQPEVEPKLNGVLGDEPGSPKPKAAAKPKAKRAKKPRKAENSPPGEAQPAKPAAPAASVPKTENQAVPDCEFEVPSDAIEAPPGIRTNVVYSNAYSRAKAQGKDKEGRQLMGKIASWLLRVHKKVAPSLGSTAAYKPRAKKGKVDEGAKPATVESAEPVA